MFLDFPYLSGFASNLLSEEAEGPGFANFPIPEPERPGAEGDEVTPRRYKVGLPTSSGVEHNL